MYHKKEIYVISKAFSILEDQVTSPCPYQFTMQILSIRRTLKGKRIAHQDP